MSNENKKVEFYGLSTCGWCRKTREWLDEHGVQYELHYVDQTQGEELEQCQTRMMQFVQRVSYPVLIIDNAKVIQGYHVEDFEKELA